MKHALEIVLNFNMRFFLKFCDCMQIKRIFFTNQAPGWPSKISSQLKSCFKEVRFSSKPSMISTSSGGHSHAPLSLRFFLVNDI